MNPQQRMEPFWLQELPLPIRLRLVAILALEFLISELGGAALAVTQGGLPVPSFIMAGFGLVGFLLLSLMVYFLWLSHQLPASPLPRHTQKHLGRAWTALALILLWYIFGGLIVVFLLDNFFGWQHLPVGLAVLAGFHLVPAADAFDKPLFLLWGALVIILSAILRISLPNDVAWHAQILGIWINLLFWTLALNQLRSLHQNIRRQS